MKLSNHSFDVAVKLNENSLKMILGSQLWSQGVLVELFEIDP